MPRVGRSTSATRLLAVYVAVTLVPVIALGFVLIHGYRSEARARGLTEARSEAAVLAGAVVEPQLDGRSLNDGLAADDASDLHRVSSNLIAKNQVLRLRLHDTSGRVVFSNDNSGFA